MAYAARTRECTECGTEVKGRIPPDGPIYCIDCTVKRMADAAFQMANKSGPAYDKWLQTRGPQGRPRRS